MSYCQYYQAHVKRSECWFFAGIFRSFEYMGFDRTLDLKNSIFEFFVPDAMEDQFLRLMNYFQDAGIVSNLQKLPNRLLDPEEKV